jgi:hypothetical protein
MKKIILCTLASFMMVASAFAQIQPIVFSAEANATVSLTGNLSEGASMSDLSWAWDSQNACFVATKQHKFTGHHVLYQTEIPTRSEMTIRVIPKDKNANLSLYAYSGGRGAIVPNLSGCVSCEADFKWDQKFRGKTQDHSRSVQLRAVNNPYPVTIGVVGAEGLRSGDFTLEVHVKKN